MKNQSTKNEKVYDDKSRCNKTPELTPEESLFIYGLDIKKNKTEILSCLKKISSWPSTQIKQIEEAVRSGNFELYWKALENTVLIYEIIQIIINK